MGRNKPRTPTRTPAQIAAARKQVIVGNTDIMRKDDHPYYVRLRQFLKDQGVDPNAALLADSVPRGEFEDGFVVAANGRVYRFVYDWRGTAIEFGVVTDWRDVTTTWPELTTDSQGRLHRDLIRSALQIREEG